jgi:NitT/TauT family transport system substrate-binding protein
VALAFGAEPAEGRFLVVTAPNYTAAAQPVITLALSTNTMMDYLVDQFFALGALDAETVQTISMPNLMLRVEALIEGRDIQAAILPEPLASYAVLAGCGILVDDTTLGVNLSQSVVLARAASLETRGEEVEKVLAATFAAMENINTTPDAYREFCLEMANVPAELAATYPTPHYTPGALPTEAEVSRVTDWLSARGLTEAYTYEEMVWGR